MYIDPLVIKKMIIKAADKVDLGDVTFRGNEQNSWLDPGLSVDSGHYEVSLSVDNYAIDRGLIVKFHGRSMAHDNMAPVIELMTVAKAIVDEFNSNIAGVIDEAKEAERKEEEQRKRHEEERAAVLAERRDRLLTEFLGEQGRIRARRSRSYQPVIVCAREMPNGDFDVDFEWVNDHDYGREKRLPFIRSFDIKVGSRYKEVWDDGRDDLSPWEKLNRGNVAKYDGELSE